MSDLPVSVHTSVHCGSCLEQLKDVLILTPLEADLIVQHLQTAEAFSFAA